MVGKKTSLHKSASDKVVKYVMPVALVVKKPARNQSVSVYSTSLLEL